MIGGGVFIVSADITRTVGTAGILIAVWLLSGLLTVLAAVSYGELAGMYPQAGGQYVYLREAYSPLAAFLYGWAFFAVIQTGTIAAVGVSFAKFTAYLIPALSEKNYLLEMGDFKISAGQLLAIAMIVLLTFMNARGIENGKWIQRIFTLTKIGSVALLILLGFTIGFKSDIWSANWGEAAWQLGTWEEDKVSSAHNFFPDSAPLMLIVAMAMASVGSLFSMDSWNNVTFVAGEMRNPQRNIGLSLLLGTLAVTVIFVGMNLMYTATLSMEDIAFAKDDRVAIAAGRSYLGDTGVLVIAGMIMISTFGCNNGLILAGARVYYTMAKDGLFFKKAGELNEFKVPGFALWAQCIWASVLCLSGRYGDLLDFVIFTVLIFYVLTIMAIFVLRRTKPELERPYKAFGYPVLPIIYIVLATLISLLLLIYKPNYSWPGLGIVVAGIPIYYWLISRKNNTTTIS